MENDRSIPQPDANPAPAAPAPYAAGTGSAQMDIDRAAFARMSYRERLALKREDPETYRSLKNS